MVSDWRFNPIGIFHRFGYLLSYRIEDLESGINRPIKFNDDMALKYSRLFSFGITKPKHPFCPIKQIFEDKFCIIRMKRSHNHAVAENCQFRNVDGLVSNCQSSRLKLCSSLSNVFTAGRLKG